MNSVEIANRLLFYMGPFYFFTYVSLHPTPILLLFILYSFKVQFNEWVAKIMNKWIKTHTHTYTHTFIHMPRHTWSHKQSHQSYCLRRWTFESSILGLHFICAYFSLYQSHFLLSLKFLFPSGISVGITWEKSSARWLGQHELSIKTGYYIMWLLL